MMKKEELILDKLTDVWNLFIELEKQHPCEANDFADGIHKCQNIIAMRFARKFRPDVFPTKE